MKNQLIEKALCVIASLTVMAIGAAASAVIKVNVIEEKVKTDRELIKETHDKVDKIYEKLVIGK